MKLPKRWKSNADQKRATNSSVLARFHTPACPCKSPEKTHPMQGLIMAGRMAQISATAAREQTPASDSDAGSETSSKRRDISVDNGLHLELDDVFKLMDFLEKEGLQVLSADIESKAIATLQHKSVKPPPKVHSECDAVSTMTKCNTHF
jgi:hypothetical protein